MSTSRRRPRLDADARRARRWSRSAPCWSGRPPRHRDDLTGGDPTAYLQKQLVNVAIGLVLMVLVLATDHRWVRILAPLVYLASVVGLVLVLTMGTTVNGSRSWLMLGGMSIQPSEFAKLAVVIGMALLGRRARRRAPWRGRSAASATWSACSRSPACRPR